MSDKLNLTKGQEEAIYSNEKNILLSAGAGSGKTFTLTQRIVRLINDGTDISDILAVTFTNAAAEELRAKIGNAVNAAIAENPGDKHMQRQLALLENARISTIDSFFKRELAPFHAEFQLPPDFDIIDEAQAKNLKFSAMHAVIEECYHDDSGSEEAAAILRLFDSISNRRNENGLESTLYEFNDNLLSRSITIDYIVELLNEVAGADELLETRYFKPLKDYTEAARMFVQYCSKEYANGIEELRTATGKKEITVFTCICDDKTIADKMLAINSYDGYCSFYSEKFKFASWCKKPEGRLEELKKVRIPFKIIYEDIAKYFSTPADEVKEIAKKTAEAFRLLGIIIDKYREKYAEAKRDYGAVDFADLTAMAEKVFVNEDGTPTESAKKAGGKFKHIFIDEYQDTSRAQDRIFAAIAAESCRFTVGDIKQSIYGFRSACPDVFREYRERYEKGEGHAIFMSDNFRCDKRVIDYTNYVSDYVFQDSGTPFTDDDKLIASKENAGDGEIKLIATDEDISAKIADEIVGLLNNGRLDSGVRIRPSDIAILVRSRSGVDDIDLELNKRGVPTFNSTNDSFYQRGETLLLICLLNMIDNPLRDIYLTGAMKSPLFLFTADELAKIRGGDRRPFWFSVRSYPKREDAEPVLCEKISKFIDTVTRLRKFATGDDALEITNRIIVESGFSRYGGDGTVGAADIKNCIKVILSEAAKVAKEGGNLGELVARLEYLKSTNAGIDFIKSEDSVNILTIHKSKGLEFPVVFILGACQNITKQHDAGESINMDNEGIASIKLFDDGDYFCGKTCLANIVGLSNKLTRFDEEARLLYVAMTRAREKLFICAKLRSGSKLTDDGDFEALCIDENEPLHLRYNVISKNNYMKWIIAGLKKAGAFREVVKPKVVEGKLYDKTAATEEEECSALLEFFEGTKDFEYKYDYLSTVPHKLSVSALKPDVLNLEEDEKEEKTYFGSTAIDIEEKMSVPAFLQKDKKIKGSDVGTATHVFMQFCDWQNLVDNGAEAEKERLIEKEFINADAAELINLSEIELFRNSSLIKRMMSAKKVIKERRFNAELPACDFTTDEELKKKLSEGEDYITVQGVIDCMFYDCDGRLVLIDYKTDKLTEAEKKDKALAAKTLIPRHKRQLEMYSEICSSILGQSFDEVYIYSVPLGDTIDISKEEG